MLLKKRILKIIGKINSVIAVKVTILVSSIWAFYAFVIFGLAPLVWPNQEQHILYWSNFLQLIFLPVITVGASILGITTEKRQVQIIGKFRKILKH